MILFIVGRMEFNFLLSALGLNRGGFRDIRRDSNWQVTSKPARLSRENCEHRLSAHQERLRDFDSIPERA
jgi:hypothetical protein